MLWTRNNVCTSNENSVSAMMTLKLGNSCGRPLRTLYAESAMSCDNIETARVNFRRSGLIMLWTEKRKLPETINYSRFCWARTTAAPISSQTQLTIVWQSIRQQRHQRPDYGQTSISEINEWMATAHTQITLCWSRRNHHSGGNIEKFASIGSILCKCKINWWMHFIDDRWCLAATYSANLLFSRLARVNVLDRWALFWLFLSSGSAFCTVTLS